ncbi:MAG: RagB/SusD family nutrient uptake outer membrane protein [Bacteroidota bacterium]
MKKFIYTLFTIALLVGVLSSCSKEALDPKLAQAKAVEGSINTVEDIKGLVYGAYNRMTSSGYYGRDFIIWGEVRSDNCFSNGNSGRFVVDARMDYTNSFGGHWSNAYGVIAIANIIINTDPSTIEGDADQLDHYIGQAYALRALCHYDLLIYYGQMHNGDVDDLGVPYIKEYKSEELYPPRDTWQNNLTDIYADIDMAISMMDPSLDDGSKEFFTYYGAHALKVRVATYFGDWSDVVSAAQTIINSGNYDIVPGADFANSFLVDGAVNSIFELAFSPVDNANINGLQYIYRGTSYGDVQALEDLYLAFDAGDVRAAPDMIGPDPDVPTRDYCNLGKYPSYDYSDNVPVLRYEEIILSYAEALWRINPADANALTQLNLVPAERGALAYTEVNEDNILLERRREFCFEGMRFHDLARTGRDIPYVDTFNQTHLGPAYGTWKFAFPIPLGEMDCNPNMLQNNGYE